MDLIFFIYIFIIIAFEVTAQYLYKYSYKYINKDNLVLVGVLFYAISGYFAYKILKYGELGVVNVIWHLIHFLALFFVGYYFLGEKLTTNKIIGSIFGIISLLIFMLDGGTHH